MKLIFRLRGPNGEAIDRQLNVTANFFGGEITFSGPELARPISVAGGDTLTIEVPIYFELKDRR
jgi:hypothetical protein